MLTLFFVIKVLSVTAVVIGVASVLFRLSIQQLSRKVLGSPVKGLPLVHVLDFHSVVRNERYHALRKLHAKHGPVFTVEGTVFIDDPALIKEVLMTPQHTIVRPPVLQNWPASEYGFLNMNSDGNWKQQTRHLLPMFQTNLIAQHSVAITNAVSRRLLPLVDQPVQPDLLTTTRLIASDVFMEWGLGLDPTSVEAQALELALCAHTTQISAAQLIPNLYDVGFLLNQSKRLAKCVDRLNAAWDGVFAALAASRKASDRPLTFISALRNMDPPLPEPVLRAELNHIYFAHKAVGLIHAYTIFELAQSPSNSTKDSVHVARLRAEYAEVLGERTTLQREDIEGLKYTRKVLDEVNRMHGGTTGAQREVDTLRVSDSVVLPKGTGVCLSLSSVHRHPKYWKNPNTFNPDRFDETPTPFSYIPFLLGKRMCAGMPTAKFEFPAVMSSILTRFDIQVHDPLVTAASLISGIDSPLSFSVHSRS